MKRHPSCVPHQLTITGKTYELGLFTGFCKKSYVDELLSADMLGFRDYLRSEDYAERTIYNYLMTVTTLLKKNGVYRIVGPLEAEDWPERGGTLLRLLGGLGRLRVRWTPPPLFAIQADFQVMSVVPL